VERVTRSRLSRWPSWAGPAAGVWSLLYAALAGTWWAGLIRYPFGSGDIADARDYTLLGHSDVAAAKYLAAVFVAAAALAAAMATVRTSGFARRALLSAGWAAGAVLVVLLPDARVLTALAYAPIALLGAPFGWPPVSFFDRALPWPVCNQLICIVGGLSWIGATLAYQRRTSGACVRCGRKPGRAARWCHRRAAARWGKIAAYVGFAVPLAYAVVRWAWALGLRIGISRAEFAALHATGLAWAGACLATLAFAGGVLTLGLVHRWGEVWPRRLPWLGGRRVPHALPVGCGAVVTIALASAGAGEIRRIVWSRPAAWLIDPMAYWPLWAVALGLATLAYHLRTRPPCPDCGLAD
jgi:hypothetical protein